MTSGAKPLASGTSVRKHSRKTRGIFWAGSLRRCVVKLYSIRRLGAGSGFAALHQLTSCVSLTPGQWSGTGAYRRRSVTVENTNHPFARSPVIAALSIRSLRRSNVSRACVRRSLPLRRSRRSGITSQTSQSRPLSSRNSRCAMARGVRMRRTAVSHPWCSRGI